MLRRASILIGLALGALILLVLVVLIACYVWLAIGKHVTGFRHLIGRLLREVFGERRQRADRH